MFSISVLNGFSFWHEKTLKKNARVVPKTFSNTLVSYIYIYIEYQLLSKSVYKQYFIKLVWGVASLLVGEVVSVLVC